MPSATIDTERHPPSLDDAFDYCAKVTNDHYENFPVASLFLPEEKRPYIQAVYAFSRTADDFADESQRNPADRLSDLNQWDEQLTRCYQGEAEHPVFVALGDTVRRTGIPIELLRDLLTAFKRDVTQNRYETFEELLDYCRCSANPVGRIVLIIFGMGEDALFELSDSLCTALQLANFWQDVAVDRNKDRLYIPLEDLKRFGYPLDAWKDGVVNDQFRSLMKYQVTRTRELFERSAALPSLVGKELQIELKLVWLGGMTILRMLEKRRFDVYHHRPELSLADKLWIFLRAFWFTDLTRYGKKERIWDPQ